MRKLNPEKIKEIIRSNIKGIDAIEVIPVVSLKAAARKVFQSINKGYIPESYNWDRKKTEHAYSYKNYKSWAKSIIVAAKYYYTDEEYPKEKQTGRIARFTWRNNYRYLSFKLEEAVKAISKIYGRPVKSEVLSNYTSIPEKLLFSYSGIAEFGKNCVLINRQMGSFFIIGEALTDLVFDFDEAGVLTPPDFSICGECDRCLTSCPTGAIPRSGEIDINRCFQFISENLILMPPEYREKWGSRLYGCSICIEVCPYNNNLEPWAEKHSIGYVGQGMDLISVLKMPFKDWTRTFNHNQIGIHDRMAIIKNLITSLGYLKFKKSLDSLYPYLYHENEVIRACTAWAIGKINTKTGKKRLSVRYKEETSKIVRAEIITFL